MPAEPRALEQSQQRAFLVVRQSAAQQRSELRDGLSRYPAVGTHVEIPCGTCAFVGRSDNARAEPLGPRVQVLDVGMGALVVLADLGEDIACNRENGRDEHVLDG